MSPSLTLAPPTSTVPSIPGLDPDIQAMVQSDVQKGRPQADALQAAQQVQMQRNSASSPINSDAVGKGFDLGTFARDNLPTIGSVALPLAAAALAPETGGLSLAALAATGGAVGEGLREKASGEQLNPWSIAGQGALGGATEGVGRVVGGLVGKAGGALSDILGKESDNLALKGLGATDNQLANFSMKHGLTDESGNATPQAVVKWINDNGLAGQGLDQISSKVGDLQGQFDGIIKNSKLTVDPAVLQQNMMAKLNPILQSTDPADTKIGESVFNNFSNITKQLGENPSLEDVNNLRKFYDGKTNYTMAQQDPQQFGPPKIVADALRQTVQDAADASGASTTAGSLKDTGQQLNKLYDLQQIAERAGFKGVSKSTPGLTNYLSSIALGNIAGPGGAVLGAAVPAVLNNPASLSVLSKGTGMLSDAVGAAGTKVGAALSSPFGVAAQQGVVGGTINAGLSQPNQVSGTGSVPSLDSNNTSQPASLASSNGTDHVLTQQELTRAINLDIQRTGGQNIDTLNKIYQAENPTGLQGISVATNALNTLGSLYANAGGAQGGIVGNLKSFAADHSFGLAQQDVKAYNDQAQTIGLDIISQLSAAGGNLGGTETDRQIVLHNIPQINDSPTLAKSKLNTLRSLLQSRLSSNQMSTPSSITQGLGGVGGVSGLRGPSLNL